MISIRRRTMCNETVRKEQCALGSVPDHLKTQEMYNEAVEKDSWQLYHVPDQYKT